MKANIIKSYGLSAIAIPIIVITTTVMLILSSIFFKIYLKTLSHFFGISHILGISEQNTFPITALLLLSSLFIFVIIRHNIIDSFISFLIFIASYGIYGYLFATFHALGNHTKPALPILLILLFFMATFFVGFIKQTLAIHTLTPGLQNFSECFVWTSIFLISSYSFFPKARPDLLYFPPFAHIKTTYQLSEPSIFFIFFGICLLALILLVVLQSKKIRSKLFGCI
jgi:hypothetical protein